MENLPQIKYHAQELHRLILPNAEYNLGLSLLINLIETSILNNSSFMGVEAAPLDLVKKQWKKKYGVSGSVKVILGVKIEAENTLVYLSGGGIMAGTAADGHPGRLEAWKN